MARRRATVVPEGMHLIGGYEFAESGDMTPTPVLFVHWGDDGIRGSERVLLDLFAKLDRERYKPLLWCNGSKLAEAARSMDVSAEVSEMPILLGWDSPKFDLIRFRGLIDRGHRLINQHGVRLVHANSGAPNQWMIPAARRARVPLLAHLHAIYNFRERCTLLLHQAPMIVGCSSAVVRPFRQDRFPEGRLRVIHNGVDPSRLNNGDATTLRAQLGIGEDSVLAVCAGALVPLKGFDVVIRALQIVVQRGLDLRLAIAGEGPERGALEALSKELGLTQRVHFLGHVANVGPILRDAADIAVVSSSIESFGLVAAEAGAMGCPTVATRVGGIPELITDSTTGMLVAPGDVNELAETLARLAGDSPLRRRVGSAARDHVLTQLTTERMTRSFESLYGQLVSQPSEAFGWRALRFRLAPFARLSLEVIGRRLGVGVSSREMKRATT